MSLAYRGLDYAAERRYAEVADVADESPALLAAERRIARSAAGLAATLGGVALFVSAFLSFRRLDIFPYGPAGATHIWLTAELLGAGARSIATYALSRPLAQLYLRRVVTRPLLRTGDAVVDLANLVTVGPRRRLVRFASRLEHMSILMPLVGMSLLLPLTIHAGVALMTGSLGTYDRWIVASALLVGHAHLVLCLCCWSYARRVRSSTADELARRGHRDWARALGFTTLAAAVPGLLLLAVPPVLTAVTGVFFIPFMYGHLRSHVIEERASLSELV